MLKYIYLLCIGFILMSCKTNDASKQKDCINTILIQDDSLGQIRNNASKINSLSNSILSYTDALNALDFSNCPQPFSSAFKKHIRAWNNIMLVTTKHPTLRGEMHDLFDDLETSKDSTEFKKYLNKIWSTWDEIEKAKTIN
ncbi:hypothetical protein [Olleya aquimaris]|uniref:Lipoprotein n=1 Tax=Olleya aquimaris TaxID=639310 RepID=A0A327RBG6_9FLAO|nr:hypothetical protein [Olleya aquimaris]RAJ13445.1 hypothetical protein LY08_01964 [Olleya aquimaris]